jgi:chromosome segregation ATPase
VQEMAELRRIQAANAQQHQQEMTELRQLQANSATQHQQEMIELRQLQASNARAIEANSTAIAENRAFMGTLGQRVDQISQQVSELAVGVDACIRTITSMNQVMETLEISRNDMLAQQQQSQQQHQAQMERIGRVLELLVTRYPMPPETPQ